MDVNFNRKAQLLYVYLIIGSYILLGNAFVYKIGNHFSIKAYELLTAPAVIMYLTAKKKVCLYEYEKKVVVWIALSAATGVASCIKYSLSASGLVSGLSYLCRILVVLLTAKYIEGVLQKNNVGKAKIIAFVLNCYVTVCLIGYFQLIRYPVANDWYDIFINLGSYYYHPDPHVNRLISTYMDPNFLAACLLIPSAIAIERIQAGDTSKLAYLLIYASTIMLTVSRSGALGLALTIMLSFILNYRRAHIKRSYIMFFLVISIAAIGCLCMSPAVVGRIMNSMSDPSTFARVRSWKLTTDFIKDNLLVGVGYNMYPIIASTNSKIVIGTDSSLLMLIVSSGLIGSAFIVVSAVASYLHIRSRKNRYKEVLIMTLVALVICNFNNLLFYVLWLFPAVLLWNVYIGEEKRNLNGYRV